MPFDLILSFLVFIIYSSFFESSFSVPLRVLCFPAHGTQGCLAGIDHGEGGEVFVLPDTYFANFFLAITAAIGRADRRQQEEQ